MATFIDLDSMWRDREIYPNPADYQLTPAQIKSWFRTSRTVQAFNSNPSVQPLDFAVSINIKELTLPYDDSIAGLPRIYVDFHCRKYNDIHLIQAIDGRHSEARFVCKPHNIQNDSNGNPLWIHYTCNMEQVTRFSRNDMIIFRVTTRDGSVIPNFDTLVPDDADPDKQILAVFEITPYLRDGDYGAGEGALIQPTLSS